MSRWSTTWKALTAGGVISGALIGTFGDGATIRALVGFITFSAIMGPTLFPHAHRMAVLRSGILEAAVVRANSEIRHVWLLGKSTYARMKKPYPAESILLNWAKGFPDGLIKASDRSGEVAGYLSAWPITETAFKKILAGELHEDEINAEDIEDMRKNPHRHWYVADIFRTKKLDQIKSGPSDYLTSFLTASFLNHHQSSGALPKKDAIEIVAFAATPSGKRLLKRFDFQEVDTTEKTHEFPVFYKCLTYKGRQAVMAKTLSTLTRLQQEAGALL